MWVLAFLILQDDPVKIVSSLPRTGSAKPQTDAIVNGIRMAVEEAKDLRIEHLDWDSASSTGWRADKEAENAERAVKDPDVLLYIGTYNSGAAKISMPLLNRARMLMISPTATWPGLTKQADRLEPDLYRPSRTVHFFRVCPPDDLQGTLGADWAKELGFRKVRVRDDGELYGKLVGDAFRTRAKEIGLELVERDEELLYYGATTHTIGPVTGPLMVPDGCFDDEFLRRAKGGGQVFLTSGCIPPPREFAEAYRKRWGSEPGEHSWYGYKAARIGIRAIRKAGKRDRDVVREACLGFFDPNGDSLDVAMSGYVVREGRFELARTLRPRPSRIRK